MKLSEERLSEAHRQRTEAILARHMSELFQRLPMLTGFALSANLEVVELSVFAWPAIPPAGNLYEQLMDSLVDLAEERPETVQLMCGRTFARAMH
jgi:hypothetical protein